ncbi:hypothetical protein NDU88_000844 [Pleurodeles waltl]|uniref:C-type lectin domain-containing protein n=1 Tax=Pleurodeles waltl TaxID=8319 RepID=A0AAV7V7Z0_PLEWA|nr:hypothetical protein NDU88_000844 [Pleurodeles waltl]
MKSLLILFTLLGLGACRNLEMMMEDAVVEESSATEPCEKMNISDTTMCPVCGIQNWHRFGKSCYIIFYSKLTFSSAEFYCKRHIRGGRLASIHSSGDNQYLKTWFPRAFSHAWLGGLYLQQEKSCVWTDGSDFNYKNWAYGEPRNQYGKELCLAMNTGGQWNLLPCNSNQPFFCEYPLQQSEVQEEESLEMAA